MFAARKTDGAVTTAANYIEDVFSTYLYTGNGSTQTITNGIDLAGKGGLVWTKNRSPGGDHILVDTVRGVNKYLISNTTAGQDSAGPLTVLPTFTSTGYTVSDYNNVNTQSYVGWTFRKQAKFFDVVTYTGDGNTSKTVSHSLGSVPGMMIIKSTTSARDWAVYYGDNTKYLVLNLTNAAATTTTIWNDTSPTSTQFTVGNNSRVNESGQTYVAYLFANNAGGFGPSGTDNVISCGSFTTSAGGTATVTLNYEPQFVILKDTGASGEDWILLDTMRGWANGSNDALLRPNLSSAETSAARGNPISTGFDAAGLSGSSTYIYIAIRRGPMKTPTSGTSVYNAITRTGTGANATVTGVGFSPDLYISRDRGTAPSGFNPAAWFDRLRSVGRFVASDRTSAEFVNSGELISLNMDGVTVGPSSSYAWTNANGYTYVYWNFKRAPGFFDVVCYTGTGVTDRVVTHNLGVAPELIITKSRSSTDAWAVGTSFGVSSYQWLYLNLTNSALSLNYSAKSRINSQPTSTQYVIATDSEINGSGLNYVAYLFATVAGVSKVGSYTGNGSSQTINCGFAAGARFVMIKRTDSTGNWVTFDTARGIVSGNDPALYLNSAAAEVTGIDAIDPDNSGFIVNQETTFNLNVNAATYIYLAIA